MMTRYVKTESGRQAIRDRAQVLSRPARNLLLILDGQRTGAEWVGLVNGSSLADLQQLADAGLIGAVPGTAPAPSTAAPTVAAMPPTAPGQGDADEPDAVAAAGPATAVLPDETAPLPERLQAVGYRHLYDTMTAQARPLLGLIKGYRMVLEVEKCSGPDELRALALRFIEDVRAAQGPGAAYRVTEALCQPA